MFYLPPFEMDNSLDVAIAVAESDPPLSPVNPPFLYV